MSSNKKNYLENEHMDDIIHKHNVIAMHKDQLQLWDTSTNKAIVTYNTSGWLCQRSRIEIKCNHNIMMVRADETNVDVFKIHTGEKIIRSGLIREFDICDTHMLTLWYNDDIVVTDLETMTGKYYELAKGLCNLRINSTHIVGLNPISKKLKVINHVKKAPVIEILTGSSHSPILINNTHIFMADSYDAYAEIKVYSIKTGKFITDFKVLGSSCKMLLNRINGKICVSTWLSLLDIKIVSIDPDTFEQSTIAIQWVNFAIGTAIAYLTPVPDDPNILWGEGSHYTHEMTVRCDKRITTYKEWEINNCNFKLYAVVLDAMVYIKKMLVKNVISDIADIILEYNRC